MASFYPRINISHVRLNFHRRSPIKIVSNKCKPELPVNILRSKIYRKSGYIISICPKTRWKIDTAGYPPFTWLQVEEALLRTS